MSAPASCPTCGRPLGENAYEWDAARGIFFTATGSAEFNGQQRLLFNLVHNANGLLNSGQLAERLYVGCRDLPRYPADCVRRQAFNVREKIEPLGWTFGALRARDGKYRIARLDARRRHTGAPAQTMRAAPSAQGCAT